jgi:hypothetical protein
MLLVFWVWGYEESGNLCGNEIFEVYSKIRISYCNRFYIKLRLLDLLRLGKP